MTAVIGLSGCTVLGSIFSFFRGYIFNLAGERVVARLRKKLFASIISQEIAFFDLSRTAELTNRLSSVSLTLSPLSFLSGSLARPPAFLLCLALSLTPTPAVSPPFQNTKGRCFTGYDSAARCLHDQHLHGATLGLHRDRWPGVPVLRLRGTDRSHAGTVRTRGESVRERRREKRGERNMERETRRERRRRRRKWGRCALPQAVIPLVAISARIFGWPSFFAMSFASCELHGRTSFCTNTNMCQVAESGPMRKRRKTHWHGPRKLRMNPSRTSGTCGLSQKSSSR